MANRAYLLQAETTAPIQDAADSSDVLAASDYLIPIFWYALFDRSCLASQSLVMHGRSVIAFPYLVAPLADARQRATERHQRFLSLSSALSYHRVLECWLDFLWKLDCPFIHLKVAELCLLDSNFEEHLKGCLGAFDASGEREPHKAWMEILYQADVDPNDSADSWEGHQLAGYAWHRAVPWEP